MSPGQVNVQVFGWDDLRVPAASRAALDGPNTGPSDAWRMQHAAFLADVRQTHGDADGVRGLALAQRRGRNRRDVDELAVGFVFEAIENAQLDLGFGVAVEVDFIAVDAVPLGDLFD
jgi:hypothetical protein